HRMLDSISFTSANCGMIKLSLINITASDMFSLSSWKIKRAMESEILVMPKPLDIQLTINPRAKAVLDSEEYSMNHPGNDPSETFAIREYIPGDSLKSIHWKLSLKTDTLLVRELGMPVMDKILLLMETALPQGISEINHDQISAVTAALYSISREIDVPHTLGWMDTVSGAYISQEIINHGDLDTAFTQLLANTIKPCGTSTIEAYKSASEGRTPSHIIIAGLYVDAAHVFGLSTVTVISCMEDLLGLEI
ncbi:MAG: DUF58 domain-containing protein, partial [Defluviitaleaceae bacterium]|nr:DUF58 domain-containing protein [Defluviitaleaceae bacterium]